MSIAPMKLDTYTARVLETQRVTAHVPRWHAFFSLLYSGRAGIVHGPRVGWAGNASERK